MRVAHEAPLCMMKELQGYTDYDYALVHLFDEIPEYYEFFVEAIANGRHVILDNSIFELEEAFDADKFAAYITKLNPTEYIVPDVLEGLEGTIANFEAWREKYDHLPGKKIGVVQGKSQDEVYECYRYMQKHADKIAISFDYSFFETEYGLHEGLNKYQKWAEGRKILLANMIEDGIVDNYKPHHLLGAGVPQEFADYVDYKWIDTIDTSNPVIHGIASIPYERVHDRWDTYWGLEDKNPTKLFTLMKEDVLDKRQEIVYNVLKFRENLNLVGK